MSTLHQLTEQAKQARSRWEVSGNEEDRLAYVACWDFAITHPGGMGGDRQVGAGCQPTILTADTGNALRYRGACLGCGHVVQAIRDRENQAVEDALEHTHPGWQDGPVLPKHSYYDAGSKQEQRWAVQMRQQLAGRVPGDWAARQGPTCGNAGVIWPRRAGVKWLHLLT